MFGASLARSTNPNKEWVMSRLPIACGMAILLLSFGRTASPVEFTNSASSTAFVFEFEAIRATCHGDNVSIDRAPNRAALEAVSPERIYQSLTDGPTAQFVLDWRDDKKNGLATAITGRPFGGHGPAIAGGMVIIGSGYAVLDTAPGNALLAFDVGSPHSASGSNSP